MESVYENDQTLTLWPGDGGASRSRSGNQVTEIDYLTDVFPAALRTYTSNEHFDVVVGADGAAYGHVITGRREEAYDGLVFSTWQTSVFRFGPDGSFSLGRSLGDWWGGEVFGVSRDGAVIGAWEDTFYRRRYFVGTSEVDYEVAGINDDGDVLGYANEAWQLHPRTGGTVSLPLTARGSPVLFWEWSDDGALLGTVRVESSFISRVFVSDSNGASWADYGLESVRSSATLQTSLQVVPGSSAARLGVTTGPEGGRSFLWLPGELRVDADRNGSIAGRGGIDNPDRSLADQSLPWFFWVNDDDDQGEIEGLDIPGDTSPNAENLIVDGVRDLVDFFAVNVDVPAVVAVFPPSRGFTYQLVHEAAAVNVVESTMTPDQVGEIHRDLTAAAGVAALPARRVSQQGIESSATFNSQLEQRGEGVLLCEGRAETQAPLRWQILAGAGGPVIGELVLPLSLAGVETMFRHVNLTSAVGEMPTTTNRGGAPNMPPFGPDAGDFVFLHGYNVNQKRARGWQAEVFKRLWTFGLTERFWGVTWYGTESQTRLPSGTHITGDYHSNAVNAFGTASALAELLRKITTETGQEPTVMGHSLGNLVVSSALSDYNAPASRYLRSRRKHMTPPPDRFPTQWRRPCIPRGRESAVGCIRRDFGRRNGIGFSTKETRVGSLRGRNGSRCGQARATTIFIQKAKRCLPTTQTIRRRCSAFLRRMHGNTLRSIWPSNSTGRQARGPGSIRKNSKNAC